MNFTAHTDLTVSGDWGQCSVINDEELSATSNEEASKVFEEWLTDENDQDLDIMQIDEQLGSDLLEDVFLQDPCVSPTCPMEELVFMNINGEDIDRFSICLLDDFDAVDSADSTSSMPFGDRYQATLQKLAESMERSRRTRKSLTMKTSKTEKYLQNSSVSGVLSSIEKSTMQLQCYLKNVQTM